MLCLNCLKIGQPISFIINTNLFAIKYKIILFTMLKLNNKCTKITFEKPMPKVLCVSTAYNETFVMVRLGKPCIEESIVHFDSQGNILFEKKYYDIIETFGQMNEKEVIVMNVPESKIDIINLENHTVRQVNHQYIFEDTAQMFIYNFPESQTFCIQEKGTFNDHRLKLTYYSYDNLEQNSQPVATYMSKNLQWTFDHMIFKGNNHSKIIWFTYKHEKEVTFTYFDLRDSPQGSLHTVRAENTIGNDYGIPDLQLNIGGIWETTKNVYMIVAASNKSQYNAKNKFGVINNNYILDATLGNDKGTLRETKFVFDIEEDGFCYNDQLIDFFTVGNISVFHTYRHDKGQTLQTPIYYVDNVTEEVIAQQTWKSTCYASNFYFPGWKGDTFIQAYHENGDVEDIIVSQKWFVVPWNMMYLHQLLQINEDFDDELLQDAIDLLAE